MKKNHSVDINEMIDLNDLSDEEKFDYELCEIKKRISDLMKMSIKIGMEWTDLIELNKVISEKLNELENLINGGK